MQVDINPIIHPGPVQGEFYWEWDGYFSENTFPSETQARQDFQEFIKEFQSDGNFTTY